MNKDMIEKIKDQLECRIKMKLINDEKIKGDKCRIYGDAKHIFGNVSGITGNVSGIYGDVSEILEILKGE